MSDQERERPRMWRYWRALPPKGRIGILFGGWHSDPIVDRVTSAIDREEMELALEEIVRLERMLVDDGALILKFWFHLSKKAQKKRLLALAADARTRWRVTDTDWERFRKYDKFRKVSENALRETSTGYAPWTVIDGTDPNYRYLTTGRAVLDALRQRLAGTRPAATPVAPLQKPALDERTLLTDLDYGQSMPRKEYRNKLEKYQGRLNLLTMPANDKYSARISILKTLCERIEASL